MPFAWFILTSCIAPGLGFRRVINGDTNDISIENTTIGKVLVSASVLSFRNEQPTKKAKEALRLQRKYDELLRHEVGEKEWRSMSNAGMTTDDIEEAKKLTSYEATRSDFLGKVLGKIVYDGTRQWATFNEKWVNPQFYDFSHPTPSYMQRQFYDQRDLYEDYLNQGLACESLTRMKGSEDVCSRWVRNSCRQKKAVFVLGPSSVGKTSSLATIATKKQQFGFPAMSYDGADWREVSEVWRTYAKESQFLLSDYFDLVFQKAAKPKMKEWMNFWITRFVPCTVFRPTTAVKHAYRLAEVPATVFRKGKGIHEEVKFFEKLGYEVHFIGITGPKAQVELFGERRSATEGKKYDRSGFHLAVEAMKRLSKTKTYRKYPWSFYLNSFEKEMPLMPLTLKQLEALDNSSSKPAEESSTRRKVQNGCSCDKSGRVQGGVTCWTFCYCRMTFYGEFDLKGMLCPGGDR